ncbi:MAG TPA: phospholipid carrier-dependent glycosyltransferase, partial [Planctomycetaceae bacterium]|nr:phospholipid carrier-dependent glycosyltransferase [Planctomycetaceae bacterium]
DHITSAEKYLQRVFFLETHPPMGKFLLALGEWLLRPNQGIDKRFLTRVDFLEHDVPEGFSFVGYRLVPAVLAFLNAPLLFLAFHKLSRHALLAAGFTVPYVFDNALVVHSRGAMLDGIQIFFVLLAILCFLAALFRHRFDRRYLALAAAFGFFVGMAAMTKPNGLVVILLGLILAMKLRHWRKTVQAASACCAAFVVPVVLGWYLHFCLGTHFASSNRYHLSPRSVMIVESGQAGRLAHFPRLFWEANRYIWLDNKGVPELDECDEEENGSWWYLWPVGGRSINYRWFTPDGVHFQYLYLQCNPAVWFLVLASVVLATGFVLARIFGEHRFSSPERGLLMVGFLMLYVCYMAAMAWIEQEQVLYLYHYLLPLVFGFFLFALCTLEVRRFFHWPVGRKARAGFLLVSVILIIATFFWYAPLTYYRPLAAGQLRARALLDVWHLHQP